MPKAKTMLDELARVLKARENSMNRYGRRERDYFRSIMDPDFGQPSIDDLNRRRKLINESRGLSRNLGDKAVMEYDRLMRSNPGRRDMQKAFRMMPDDLMREHDYFDR